MRLFIFKQIDNFISGEIRPLPAETGCQVDTEMLMPRFADVKKKRKVRKDIFYRGKVFVGNSDELILRETISRIID